MAGSEIRVLLRVARRQRFRVERGRSGHYRVTTPNGRRWTTVPCSPKGGKAERHRTRAVLRRIGVQL